MRDLGTPGHAVGKDQMADQKPPAGDALFVQFQVSHLPMHLRDCNAVAPRVVGNARQAFAHSVVRVLHVGHVDVDHAVEKPQGGERIVAPCVVDERQPETLVRSQDQGGEYLRHHMAGRDEVDVLAAQILKSQHGCGDLGRTLFPPPTEMAEIVVLAEHAGQIAAGEEDRARTSATHQWRLLTVVRPGTRHPGEGTGPALAQLAGQSVHSAAARA